MALRGVNCPLSIHLIKTNVGPNFFFDYFNHGSRKERVKSSKGGKNRVAEGKERQWEET